MSLKKFLDKVVFICICTTMVLFSITQIMADEPVKEGIDVVLLIDTSGSMRGSDKSRNAIEATNMFIDMMELKSSRVAVVGFTDTITGIVEMREINTQKDKDDIKDLVNSFEYEGFTDIGMSLKTAVSMVLEKSNEKNSPMILLLTDGKIDMDPENNDRTQQTSYDDIAEALGQAGKKLPIYTIGLNSNESVDRELLESISETTNGRDYIIDEADILPQIFNEIFADHIKSSLFEITSFIADGESYADVAINIDNDFVAEANIIMLSENEIIDVKLFDPDGNEVEFDQSTITLSKSRKYSMVKVLTPKRGEWHLKSKGIKNDKIRVNLIYQYDVTVEMSVTQQNLQNNQYDHKNNITVTGYLIANGQKTTDSSLYENTISNLVITDVEGNIIDEILLDSFDSGFKVEYTPKSDENIKMYITTKNENFQKESNVAEIEFLKTPAAEVPEPTPEQSEAEPKEASSSILKPIRITIIITIVLFIILMLTVLLYVKNHKPIFFSGYIELRAMDSSSKYTSLETPTLATYVKKITLHQFITESLRSEVREKILMQSLDIEKIYFSPGKYKNQDVIYIENKSNTLITDAYGNKKEDSKIMWKSDEMIILKVNDDSIDKLEMTFRQVEEI